MVSLLVEAQSLKAQLIQDRRDFHKYAESGWFEFRTASLVARRLHNLGLDLRVGREVMTPADRMGLPDAEALEAQWQRAVKEGGDPHYLEQVRKGFTAVVGSKQYGAGPVVGLRFDMDALDIEESTANSHRPAREGFASIHKGMGHACGHDGHTAIGLGIAKLLTSCQENLRGTVKLIFQPAEEGVRGAKSMVSAGVVDDVDYLVGLHLSSGWKTGEIVGGKGGYLATSKFNAEFTGLPAHAGGAPHKGKNALLAAANAVINLYAIPRHRAGATRINVGRLVAGTGRNVICPNASLWIETRGENSEINDYMVAAARRVLEAAAAMYDVSLSIIPMGEAQSANSNAQLARRVEKTALTLGGFAISTNISSGGSEDFTYMMRRVQANGGLATNIGLGADLGGFGGHTAEYDFDEGALPLGVALLTAVTINLLGEAPVR
jgi:aminobenzoyl-glutamate utilization protein A